VPSADASGSDSNYYVLIAADVEKGRLSEPSAYDIAVHRMKLGFWGLRIRTRNSRSFKPGDFAVVYAAGKRERGGHFMACFDINSVAGPIPQALRGTIDSPSRNAHLVSELCMSLKNPRFFEHPVNLAAFAGKLEFLRSAPPGRWGLLLLNGAIRIPLNDYVLITGLGGELHPIDLIPPDQSTSELR
jgi:hypothetical protein